MRRFFESWKKPGLEKRYCAKTVNYADDFVICCKNSGEKALSMMRNLMERLKLTVNEEKTKLCHLPEENFIFPGYE
jgi:predicted transcriptional regulator